MNKKRFILAEDSNGLFSIFDNEDKENEPLIYGAEFGTDKIVDLLNEQQSTIKYLTIEKHQADKRFQTIIAELKKENEQLRKENNFLKQIREAFQIDVKNSRQMLKGRDSDE